MSTNTTFDYSRLLGGVVALTAVWAVLMWGSVALQMDWSGANYVGQTIQSGIVGLLVLAALVVLLAGLLVTPGDTDPDPRPWPPE